MLHSTKNGFETINIYMKCLFCNNNIVEIKYQTKFCNSSCAAKFNNKKRIRHKWSTKRRLEFSKKCTLMAREKQLANRPADFGRHTCCVCNKIFISEVKRKTCGDVCKNKLLSQISSDFLKNTRSHIRGPHLQSYMEFSFEQWLIEKGFKRSLHGYLTDVHFYNHQTKKNGFADFVFPKLRIIIELDGTHHLKRIELDKIRDDYLRSRNWKVIRIPHKEYIAKTRIHEISTLLKIGVPGEN